MKIFRVGADVSKVVVAFRNLANALKCHLLKFFYLAI
jgi:hypothetical protein